MNSKVKVGILLGTYVGWDFCSSQGMRVGLLDLMVADAGGCAANTEGGSATTRTSTALVGAIAGLPALTVLTSSGIIVLRSFE